MNEQKKAIFPRDPDKLHELAERLENEIADRQAKLVEVRRREKEAKSATIYNLMMERNVTTEELIRIVDLYRSGRLPGMNSSSDDDDVPSSSLNARASDYPGYEGYEIERRDSDDE